MHLPFMILKEIGDQILGYNTPSMSGYTADNQQSLVKQEVLNKEIHKFKFKYKAQEIRNETEGGLGMDGPG